MSRMLDALKVLEGKRSAAVKPTAVPVAPRDRTVLACPPERVVAGAPSDDEPETAEASCLPFVEFALATDADTRGRAAPLPDVASEAVALPITSEIGEPFLELAGRISDQLAANYCNVLLFVTPDPWAESSFSMTHLAQAFALQCPGDILLVDGDLRARRLSKSVCPPSRGIIEVMLGGAQWPDVIHPTNARRIDFVASGTGNVPTVERPQFGWGALRPLYRAVLIGLSSADEPETEWLAERCDGVYFVISRPHTKRQAAVRGVNALRAGGANVLGCIVANDPTA